MGSERISLNVPSDVSSAWRKTYAGVADSVGGMAGYAAFLTLPDGDRATLLNLCFAVTRDRATWADVVAWVDRHRQAAAKVEAVADELAVAEAARPTPKGKPRRKK